MKTALTRETAEKVLKQVTTKYAAYIEAGYEPKLIQDWDWVGHTPWAIIWEEGPDEWAYNFGGGGFDYEIYEGARAFGKSEEEARKLATVEPTADLPGVFTEPVTGWALGIYEA